MVESFNIWSITLLSDWCRAMRNDASGLCSADVAASRRPQWVLWATDGNWQLRQLDVWLCCRKLQRRLYMRNLNWNDCITSFRLSLCCGHAKVFFFFFFLDSKLKTNTLWHDNDTYTHRVVSFSHKFPPPPLKSSVKYSSAY